MTVTSINQKKSASFKENVLFLMKGYRPKFTFLSLLLSVGGFFLTENPFWGLVFYSVSLSLLETVFYKILGKRESDNLLQSDTGRQKMSKVDYDRYFNATYWSRIGVLITTLLLAGFFWFIGKFSPEPFLFLYPFLSHISVNSLCSFSNIKIPEIPGEDEGVGKMEKPFMTKYDNHMFENSSIPRINWNSTLSYREATGNDSATLY